ncbi:Pr6Pr family membrane protein [Demequina lutea]|uniref:Uncharacterized protein (DUF983 family) n=1 Tax=Demequina lutea TaxID=431489 RepID=A0A7Z0CIM7_9MICO|nr:Pr6Pr family membrane protein [Demequina lutea]NYI39902.1 uncharacterized protein (DUF983 family) [Demequina lutea]
MTTAIRTWRVLGAALIIAALVANVVRHLHLGDFAFFDTLGYFSQQSNILAAILLLVVVGYTGRPRPLWLEYARASVTMYLVIVTVVFWTLLGGFEPGDPYRWSTLTMHGISCVILLADWLLEGPRKMHPIRRAWVVLPYAVVWIAVAIVRGATDGWIPYPFMDPKDGYAPVVIVVGGIVVVGLAIGAVLFRLTRWRVVTAL